MTGTPDPRLRDLALLRRVRDRIDREYAQPLDVEALARGVHVSAGHLSRQFRAAYGESPYSYRLTRRIERAKILLRAATCRSPRSASRSAVVARNVQHPVPRVGGRSPSAYRRLAAEDAAGVPQCVAKQVMRPVRRRTPVAAPGGAP